jgi:hypothetical protein
MANQHTSDGIPLPAVAARLRMSWSQAFNAVLSGKLRGKQQSNGRWLVEEASIAEYQRRLGGRLTVDTTAADAQPESAMGIQEEVATVNSRADRPAKMRTPA